jgi:hypothetical protein
LVDEMSRSRFVERFRSQDHSISCGTGEDGVYRTAAPEYDWDDFRSFLTIFRQVAISTKEPVYITKVLNTAGLYANAELRENLGEIRKEITPRLDGRYRGMKLGMTLGEQEVSLSVREILDALVNGLIFHSDPGHKKALAVLDASERWCYLWPLLFEIIRPCLVAFIWLFHAFRRYGILTDADYPARCLKSDPSRVPVPG